MRKVIFTKAGFYCKLYEKAMKRRVDKTIHFQRALDGGMEQWSFIEEDLGAAH